MGSVIRTGLQRLNAGDEEGLPEEVRGVKGRYGVALGAIGCFFQREIAPMQGFEVWTRILSWDRKWLYLVSHVVRAGTIKPESYVLQPWKKGTSGSERSEHKSKSKNSVDGEEEEEEEDLKKHIFATSIARYVVKKGRLTVNPEIILERSRMLPPRPKGMGLPPRSEDPSVVATPASAETPEEAGETNGAIGESGVLVAEEVGEKLGGVDAERLRGLKMASHFDQLSGLHDEMRAGEVLGRYSDWF
jgi:hypothetical protein